MKRCFRFLNIVSFSECVKFGAAWLNLRRLFGLCLVSLYTCIHWELLTTKSVNCKETVMYQIKFYEITLSNRNSLYGVSSFPRLPEIHWLCLRISWTVMLNQLYFMSAYATFRLLMKKTAGPGRLKVSSVKYLVIKYLLAAIAVSNNLRVGTVQQKCGSLVNHQRNDITA